MSTTTQIRLNVPSLGSNTKSNLDDEVVKSCCNLCIRTAYDLVDNLYDNLGTLYRSSGWHAVYCESDLMQGFQALAMLTLLPVTFSAAIVLLASLKCDMVVVHAGEPDFEACWSHCISILEHYRDQISSAKHAILVLKAMRDQIRPVIKGVLPLRMFSLVLCTSCTPRSNRQ